MKRTGLSCLLIFVLLTASACTPTPPPAHTECVPNTPASCTELRYCTVCGKELPALGHDYSVKTVQATCTRKGTATHTCRRCGDSYVEETPMLPHDDRLTSTVQATAYEEGYDVYTCSKCKATRTGGSIPKNDRVPYEEGVHYTDGAKNLDKTLFYVNGSTPTNADPGIIRITDETSPFYGLYFLYGTGTGYYSYASNDLVNWRPMGKVFNFPENGWEGTSQWAPEIVYDENADPTAYGLSKPARGKGVYFMLYSATHKEEYQYGTNPTKGYYHQTGLALATSPVGPFIHYTGKETGAIIDGVNYALPDNFALYTTNENNDIFRARKNGQIGDTDPFLNASAMRAKIHSDYEKGAGYLSYDFSREDFTSIDSSFFTDKDGTRYVIVRNFSHLKTGADDDGFPIAPSTPCFLIKTIDNDWSQLDYSSAILMNRTLYDFTSQAAAVEYNRQAQAFDETAYPLGFKETRTFRQQKNDVEAHLDVYNWNEGPLLYYNPDTGLYYFSASTTSTWDENGSSYSVVQFVAYNVAGPYRKLSMAEGGMLLSNNRKTDSDNVGGPGHHNYIEVDGELYIVYHRHMPSTSTSRTYAIDKISWLKNAYGMTVMHVNGPTTTPQPLLFKTGTATYDNIATDAALSSTGGENLSALTDGAFLVHDITASWVSDKKPNYVKEFESTDLTTTVTLDFSGYRRVVGLMVYNSKTPEKAFSSVSVECDFYKDGKTGTFTIDELAFDKSTGKSPSGSIVRAGAAAIATFSEIEIAKIRLTFKKTGAAVAASEIVVLGIPNEEPVSHDRCPVDETFVRPLAPSVAVSTYHGITVDGVRSDGEWDGYQAYETTVTVTDNVTKETCDVLFSAVGTVQGGDLLLSVTLSGLPVYYNPDRLLTRNTIAEVYFLPSFATNNTIVNTMSELDLCPYTDPVLKCRVYNYLKDEATAYKTASFTYLQAAGTTAGEINDGSESGFTVEIRIPLFALGAGNSDNESVYFFPAFIYSPNYTSTEMSERTWKTAISGSQGKVADYLIINENGIFVQE